MNNRRLSMQLISNTYAQLFMLCLCMFGPIETLATEPLVQPLQHTLTVKQAQADIDQWFNWLHQTHPDLSHSVKDIDGFYSKVSRIKNSIEEPVTAIALWQKMAPLNSILADGHIKVGHGSSSQWREWIKQGVVLFPLEINVTEDGMYVARDLGEQDSQYKGAKIKSINGQNAAAILKKLLKNTHGDTLAFRRRVLQNQFHRLFYMTFGPEPSFNIELAHNNQTHRITLDAKAAISTSLAEKSFSDAFNITYRDNTALLQVNTFSWHDFKQYLAYMDDVFSEIKTKNIDHLIIDIRYNGGGNDDMWMAGILKYIANKPYRHFSHYRSKILLKYRDPGQIVGNIERGEKTNLIQPEKNLANFYHGKTSVLIGTGTYSSSIVFANTVQDYNFAQLIGTQTGGRSTQSGGIQFKHLIHSQLQMVSPRFLITRPSAELQVTPVQPDISLSAAKINNNIKALL